VLCFGILPGVLKENSPEQLIKFESAYEKIGMPALIVQILTGLWMAHNLLPDFSEWFNMSNPLAYPIAAKLLLLALTFAFALDARFRVIPNLSVDNLRVMAWHIIPVTIFSILFVVVGVSFRSGWLY